VYVSGLIGYMELLRCTEFKWTTEWCSMC